MLRRTHGEVKPPSIIHAGALEINSKKYTATLNGRPLHFTPNEFKLLCLLASRPGQTLTREQLLDDLHGAAKNNGNSGTSIKNLHNL